MAEAAAKQPFWRRMTNRVPGQVRAVPPGGGGGGGGNARSSKSFSQFADQSKDAWEDGDEDLDYFTRSQRERAKAGQAQLEARREQQQSTVGVDQQEQQQQQQQSEQQSEQQYDMPAGYHPPPQSAAAAAAAPPPSRDDLRSAKFQRLLTAPNLDLDSLREASWSGIPAEVRHTVWMLLSGYLPANQERRELTLQRKRDEYRGFVDQYYGSRHDASNERTFHQISIDVPRTIPSVPTFQHEAVQKLFERVLYIWAIRHPGSGYVQGINDLVTPFFAVFITPHLPEGVRVECCEDLSCISEDTLFEVEADSFWCMSKLLDGIQDNYTFAQPGIQKKVKALSELVSRIDESLYRHLEQNDVQFLQFAFRWMNCLLMREIPFHCTVRLWDTYHAEPEGFASFHLYACAAFLETFSKQLQACNDFQQLMFTLQTPPTAAWSSEQIDLMLAEAYRLKYMFHGAKNHLT